MCQLEIVSLKHGRYKDSRSTWISSHELTRLDTTCKVVEIPNLIKFAVVTLDNGTMASWPGKSGLDLSCCVGLCGRGKDACSSEELHPLSVGLVGDY